MTELILAVFLFVWVPLFVLIGLWAGRRRASVKVVMKALDELGPDFCFDRAPDYVGTDFTCERCGFHAGLAIGTIRCSLRGRCPCGTVYELISSNI